MLNEMTLDYQSENKKLKATILSLQQDLYCKEKALIKSGKKCYFLQEKLKNVPETPRVDIN